MIGRCPLIICVGNVIVLRRAVADDGQLVIVAPPPVRRGVAPGLIVSDTAPETVRNRL
jgi:hypothetical protein